jgi:predicted DNA-binding transcriptional regulator YafY
LDAEGAKTERPVRPLGLWFWGKVWTLVAWCELRDDFRMFRVDRIADITERGSFTLVSEQNLAMFYARQAALGVRNRQDGA